MRQTWWGWQWDGDLGVARAQGRVGGFGARFRECGIGGTINNVVCVDELGNEVGGNDPLKLFTKLVMRGLHCPFAHVTVPGKDCTDPGGEGLLFVQVEDVAPKLEGPIPIRDGSWEALLVEDGCAQDSGGLADLWVRVAEPFPLDVCSRVDVV